jgi:hypothetical protein
MNTDRDRGVAPLDGQRKPRSIAGRRAMALLLAVCAPAASVARSADVPVAGVPSPAELAANFVAPPPSARPWVYWFWNNGNVTHEGITADLEAMKRVGIGGVLIMDVVERFAPPKGPATFMGDVWRDDFQFALSEAARLGLEVNMTNAAGWCGSSGPWITPELSMQKLVVTELNVDGPTHYDGARPGLPPKPAGKKRDVFDSIVAAGDFYKDVALLAVPITPENVVQHGAIIDLTRNVTADGRLVWDAPPGKWVVQRVGHVSTMSSTRPPVLGGNGLECDKLSAAAMDFQFAHFIGKLKADAGPAGKALVATHIDSWEVGSQDWTGDLAAEFQRRRGYSLVPYLTTYGLASKRQVDSLAQSERFRWDFYQTIGDLLAERYTGELAKLAHAAGLRLTTEGYDLPFGDEATYTAPVDEPMTEFWGTGGRQNATKALEMASVAHVFGRPILGAEAFTSNAREEWRYHPATIKAMGDHFFGQGVNRFVFHRYAMQPYLDRAPGATMGPWGLHYERTNTWWEMSGPWHAYLARCQQVLRQGRYVADVLYLRPQHPNLGTFNPTPPLPAGYRSDQISATALIDRATVRDGRIEVAGGMTYRVLVMPPVAEITPELAEKVRDLISAGATVLGPRPTHAPGLTDYPHCDERVAAVADAVWGPVGSKPVGKSFGKGSVSQDVPLADLLTTVGMVPDLLASAKVDWIHRQVGAADVYFVANPGAAAADVAVDLRSTRTRAERWDAETGARYPLAVTPGANGTVHATVPLESTESCFIVLLPTDATLPPLMAPLRPLTPVAGVTGPWAVHFPVRRGPAVDVTLDAPSSWATSDLEPVQHFSGTATYTRTLTVPADAIAPGRRLFLDLGDVQVMAHATVNGRDVGIAWKPPYRLDITAAVHGGDNPLKVDVVNLWVNRLIGDSALPKDQRSTWSSWEPYKPTMPLVPSGLIGPVRLMAETTDTRAK